MESPEPIPRSRTKFFLALAALILAVTTNFKKVLGWFSADIANDVDAAMASIAEWCNRIPVVRDVSSKTLPTIVAVILLTAFFWSPVAFFLDLRLRRICRTNLGDVHLNSNSYYLFSLLTAFLSFSCGAIAVNSNSTSGAFGWAALVALFAFLATYVAIDTTQRGREETLKKASQQAEDRLKSMSLEVQGLQKEVIARGRRAGEATARAEEFKHRILSITHSELPKLREQVEELTGERDQLKAEIEILANSKTEE